MRIDVAARTKCSSGTYTHTREIDAGRVFLRAFDPTFCIFASRENERSVPSSPATHTTKPYYYYALRASEIYNCNYV